VALRPRSHLVLVLATVLLTTSLAARHLYRAPYSASDLRVTPDEVEYAVCAQRIATLGRYDLDLDGVRTPPHSTPWFSALLAPAYLAAPDEVGNGIWVVFAFAVAGVIVVQRIGTIVAGPIGGALAVIALLAFPPYPYTARLIMTDGPSTVLGLVGLWLFLRWSSHPPIVRESFVAGVLIAFAFALRSVYLSMLVPFAWRALRGRERRAAHFAALLAPLAAVLVANAAYNHATFGDWRRTGYQYWCAVPYDYPALMLSLANLRENLENFWIPVNQAVLAAGALGAIALAIRRPPRWRELVGYSAVTALPISALHLVYFYPSSRFHVYMLALCAVLGGIGIASLVPIALRDHLGAGAAAVAALCVALIAMKPFAMPQPSRRLTADAIHAATPDGSVIISGLEPVYLAAVAPTGSHRMYLAASRDVEFVSKVLSRERIDRALAAPIDARDHAAIGLLEHGSRWAVAHTADEMHAPIEAWVRGGRPVFLESEFLPSGSSVQRILGTTLRLADPHAALTRIVAAD
jgi:hypothetical protein